MSACVSPELGQLLAAYEIGGLDESDAERFEIHLLECEHCFKEVESFRVYADVLRSDPRARAAAEQAVHEHDRAERMRAGMPRARPRAWLLWSLGGALVGLMLSLGGVTLLRRVGSLSSAQPAVVVQLVPDRGADTPSIAEVVGHPVVVLFVFADARPGQPYHVTLRASDGQVVYDEPDYRAFDAYETGSLVLPAGTLSRGTCILTIRDPQGDPKTSTQEYRFRVGT
jgi:hypothetical protein